LQSLRHEVSTYVCVSVYLIFAQASCDETLSHLDTINVLYPDIKEFDGLDKSYDTLGKKINKYIKYVENNWRT